MRTVVVMVILLHVFAGTAFAQALPIESLVDAPWDYEGQQVQIQGEVVGDVMVRGDYAWINISDDTGVMGVYIPAHLVRELVPGRYTTRGDIVEVTGIFNRSCTDHGGDMDLHASALQVIRHHQPIEHPIQVWKYIVTGVLALVYGALMLEQYLRRRRGRNVQV